jgi:hypothetical protein
LESVARQQARYDALVESLYSRKLPSNFVLRTVARVDRWFAKGKINSAAAAKLNPIRDLAKTWKVAGGALTGLGAAATFGTGYADQLENDEGRQFDPLVGGVRASLRGGLNTVGSLTVGALGASGGIALGAACGPFAPACVPTFAVVGAVGGSWAGEQLGNWTSDRAFEYMDGPTFKEQGRLRQELGG